MIHHYLRCPHCERKWFFSYDIPSMIFNFWRVMAEKAYVEMEFANHQVDCILAEVENEHV
jgi:hypothetical protein